MKKINIGKKPFLYPMPDNNFWSIGKQIGKAWSIGKDYR